MNFHYPRILSLLYREGTPRRDCVFKPGDIVTLASGFEIDQGDENIIGIVFCTAQPHTVINSTMKPESRFYLHSRYTIVGVIWSGLV